MSMIATDLEADPAADRPANPSPLGEAVRYFGASLAALALDAGLLWTGVRILDLPPWMSGAFGYGAGLILIYVLSIRWVFAKRAIRDSRAEFFVFSILGAVGLVVNSLTLFVATDLGVALPFAKAMSAGLGFVANFASRKILLFTWRRP